MGKSMFQPDYARHGHIYAANPAASGWNEPAVDAQIRSYVDELLAQAQLAPPARLLEVGYGMGNLTLALAAAGFHMAGIDISTTAIEVACQRGLHQQDQAEFRVGDVTSVHTYRGYGSFECILDRLCWHCITGADRQRFLDVGRHLLKPQGCLLVLSMYKDPRSSRLLARFDAPSCQLVHGQIAERYLGQPQDLEAELPRAGFLLAYRRLVAGSDGSGDQNVFLAVAKVP
jgi:ubiquinone/menaquinone biosynthesis C-methylase UbiE